MNPYTELRIDQIKKMKPIVEAQELHRLITPLVFSSLCEPWLHTKNVSKLDGRNGQLGSRAWQTPCIAAIPHVDLGAFNFDDASVL